MIFLLTFSLFPFKYLSFFFNKMFLFHTDLSLFFVCLFLYFYRRYILSLAYYGMFYRRFIMIGNCVDND